jgi:hypothetical protein
MRGVIMKELSKTITTIAGIYGFRIDWDCVLLKWLIRAEEEHCSFFWDSTETLEDFLDGLKEYFKEIGAEVSH